LLEQYKIAEESLNIISGSQQPQIKNVDKIIDQILMNKPAFEKLLDALAEKMGSRLAPIKEED
jgi:hypothetical protein